MVGSLRGQGIPLQRASATSGPMSSMAHRPPTPPTRRRRQRAYGASSHALRLQPPSSTPLRSRGLSLWVIALSPEPGPLGRTQARPATPAPKPRLASPSAFQLNKETKKATRERNIRFTRPSWQPNDGGSADAQMGYAHEGTSVGRFALGVWVCGCYSELAFCASGSSRCV